MQFMTVREVVELTRYSRQHLLRLERQGRFPKRLRLGNGLPQFQRAYYVRAEIEQYLNERLNERNKPTDTPE